MVDSSGLPSRHGKALKLSAPHSPLIGFPCLLVIGGSYPYRGVHPPANKTPRIGGPRHWLRARSSHPGQEVFWMVTDVTGSDDITRHIAIHAK